MQSPKRSKALAASNLKVRQSVALEAGLEISHSAMHKSGVLGYHAEPLRVHAKVREEWTRGFGSAT